MVHLLRFGVFLSSIAASLAQQVPLLSENGHRLVHKLEAKTKSDLLDLHRNLIEIDSITGNEKKVGEWLSSYLEEHGLTVEKQYVSDDRFNVFAYPGKSRETKILVSSHIDTVPPFLPYSFKEPNEIWGRGSVDAKGDVAAQVIALLDVLKSADTSDQPSVSLLFVVGEEKDGIGMKHFSAHKPTNYSAVIFGEPTEAKLATGHKGLVLFTLDIKGRAAHSGYPWLGLSATNALVEALGVLRNLENKLPCSPKLGETTVNVGKIEGGVAANVVAEHASAEIAIRIAAGTPKAIEDIIDKAFKHIKTKVEKAGGEFSVTYSEEAYGPVLLDTDIDGFEKMGVNYGTDVPNLKGDHKTYLYGPGSILVAHGPNEHLTTDQMEDAVLAYRKIITELLKR